jgi:hypothetical protein
MVPGQEKREQIEAVDVVGEDLLEVSRQVHYLRFCFHCTNGLIGVASYNASSGGSRNECSPELFANSNLQH